MLKEGNNLRNLTLDEFRSIPKEKFTSVSIEGRDITSNRSYELGFTTNRYGPHIKISTEQRRKFLKKGTEQQVEGALVYLGLKVRGRSGGYFNIHPFYGAVWRTKITPVLPNFLKDLEDSDERLSMTIFLNNNGENFNPRLTNEYVAIDHSLRELRPNKKRLLAYLENISLGNPNQRNRDQAIVYGLREAWQREFEKFNSGIIPQAMEISPSNVVDLMRSMESEGIKNTRISRLNLNN